MGRSLSDDKNGLVKRDRVEPGAGPARVPVGDFARRRGRPTDADPGGEPDVKVARGDDGTVQQITVRCPCGREIILQCEYFGRGDEDAKKLP